jgi:hypothetical protein
MSNRQEPVKLPAAPAGEEIHLPGPTPLPLITAVAVTLMVVGTTLSWVLTGAGAVLFGWSAVRWIRETRGSIAELPEPAADDSAAG